MRGSKLDGVIPISFAPRRIRHAIAQKLKELYPY
jgi:hypothetical protein